VRYFFRIEYDGAAYHGWQRQPNGVSVQEELERAFSIVLRQTCSIVGGGRTDAGVHARRQGAHMDTESAIDTFLCERSVNGVLAPDIAVFGLQAVPEDFHARFSAVERRYTYSLVERKTPLLRCRAWHVTYTIDWVLMQREARSLIGTHDFATFCASGSDANGAVCTVRHAGLALVDGQWVFSLSANRFVYKMVRSVVGTLVEIGRGARDDSMADILRSRERARAGVTAPAHGLVLEDVVYPGVDT